MRRYPLAALVEASGLTEAALGRRVGLSGTTLKLARFEGLVESAADRYACRAGLTPLEVWDDWGLAVCASVDCDARFAPRDVKGQQRFCSATCRHRERARRYRATVAGAEAARRSRRTFYWSDEAVRLYEARVKKSLRERRKLEAA